MEQNYINLLSINKFNVIMSARTKKPYMTDDGACFLYEINAEASKFCEKTPDTYVEGPKILKQTEFCNGFYSLGIKKINVQTKTGELVEIPLSKKDVPRGFYNPKCNFSTLMLKQTKKKKYLNDLKSRKFLTPARVDPRVSGKISVVHYCYAYLKDNKEKMFLLFSSLDEFNEWNEKKEKKMWKPLNIEFKNFDRIRKKNSVVINPLSDKVILNNAQIQTVMKTKE